MQYPRCALLVLVLLIVSDVVSLKSSVGYQVGSVQGYTVLRKSGLSTLYQIECPEIKDGRPVKLLELVGSHKQVGHDYATLLGKQILYTYDTFMKGEIQNPIELAAMEMFLDWQYDTLLSRGIPQQFKEELKGIQEGGHSLGIKKMRLLFQRVLMVSAYPGHIGNDIGYAMVDAFLEEVLRIKNPVILNWVENNMFRFGKLVARFLNRKRIHCTFMAAWGSRTQGGQLYTMRNLDWEANTGINKNKIIFVWKVTNTIPHTTIGFPLILGALTGMSKAGLTVHEAGLDSYKETELGMQWSIRLRYILMHAHNLSEAKHIWNHTENTFGMNHMVASAGDVKGQNAPVFVVETMRGYNAWFEDKDPREDNTYFIDPKTKQKFRAGYAMKDVVFRTNHAYDPTINKYKIGHPGIDNDSMKRYFMLKDGLNDLHGPMEELSFLNLTAIVADKSGPTFYHCPKGKDKGINVISVMFMPAQQRMYAAIEYGGGDQYKTAACGVFVDMDMRRWFT